MNSEIRTHAEDRLAEAAGSLGLADPRTPLRARLKQLRDDHPDAFDRAVSHYERTVLPLLAGEDPLGAWLDYGRFVGQLTSNGRLTTIDETGLAAAFRPPVRAGVLVLFIPEDTAVETLVAAAPRDPSPAQQATLGLLVERRLAL